MGTKLLLLALLSTGLVFGHPDNSYIRIPHPNHNSFQPHLCDAEGESSEECNRHSPGAVKNIDLLDNIFPPSSVDSLKVRFFLHKNPENPEERSEIFLESLDSIQRADPYPRTDTTEWKVLIPGFPMNGKGPFPKNALEAYMKRMHNVPTEKYNILVVDWNKGPCLYNTKFENTTYTGAVGEKVAEMLLLLDKRNYLSIREDTHIIGFSVGAHVAGEASRYIFRKFSKKNLLYRITALDPAGNNFWPKGFFENIIRPTPWERVPRIRRSFVGFLDVIHTSSEYGMARRMGDIDFYPNGGNNQPGCNIWVTSSKLNNFKDLCNHVYATELFAKSINDKAMKGCTGCDYYDLFKQKKCECEDHPVLGEFVDEEKIDNFFPKAAGVAFLDTGDLGKFAERLQRRLEDMGEPKNNRGKWNQLCD